MAANHYYKNQDEWEADLEAVRHTASAQPRKWIEDIHTAARIKSADAVVKSVVDLYAGGFDLDEIQEMIGPSYVDGSPWAISSIAHIINTHPQRRAPAPFTDWVRPMSATQKWAALNGEVSQNNDEV